jgi:putative spermidine/putrescine transport system ATP-binding protein
LADAALRARHIVKRYGPVVALDDVSLDIGAGEFLTLLGPSGSGKTTFLMCLAGFVEPTSGTLHEVAPDGAAVDITRRPAEERRFGMVFQGYALFPHMTVAENVAFPLKVARVGRAERDRRVREMLVTVGLGDLAGRRPSELSGGQQQRVALARALVVRPKVLLLDEPLSALDKNLREQMQDEIRALHRTTGATFVFVTHDQAEALALSSRIAIFDRGRIEQAGTPEAVYETPANRFVAEFLGRINLIPIEEPTHDGTRLSGRFEARTLTAPAPPTPPAAPMIAVRPEHMRLAAAEPNGALNGIRATVRDRIYGGSHAVLELTSASGLALSLDVPAHAGGTAHPGEEVWVTWPKDTGFALSGDTKPPTGATRGMT